MTKLQDILDATQEEIATLAIERAKHGRTEALFHAAAANNLFEKSKLELQEGTIMLQRAHNVNRPSILLGAHLSTEERSNKIIYIADARGLAVEGDTPENAFLNFDDTWVGKDDESLTQGENND
jgi:hypothetical protein